MIELEALSRREREVMQIVLQLEGATAAQVRERMADPPTDAAVRSILRILVEKGHLTRRHDGPRYVYSATASPNRVRRSAVRNLLRTFFGGSVEGAMAALLELEGGGLSAEERDRLKKLIDEAAEEGR